MNELKLDTPAIIQIGGTAELWTTESGMSLFSFDLYIDNGALMRRAGLENVTALEHQGPRLAVWEVDPTNPHVIAARVTERLTVGLSSLLHDVCDAKCNGGGGDCYCQQRYFCYNVPAAYAKAMAELFRQGGREVAVREGFMDPDENIAMPQLINGNAAPTNLNSLLQRINEVADDAVTNRNVRLIPRASSDQGSFEELRGPSRESN